MDRESTFPPIAVKRCDGWGTRNFGGEWERTGNNKNRSGRGIHSHVPESGHGAPGFVVGKARQKQILRFAKDDKLIGGQMSDINSSAPPSLIHQHCLLVAALVHAGDAVVPAQAVVVEPGPEETDAERAGGEDSGNDAASAWRSGWGCRRRRCRGRCGRNAFRGWRRRR